MGHPDGRAAAKAKFMLNQISAVQHFSQTNRVEDMRVILFVVVVPGFGNLFNVKLLIFIVRKVAKVTGVSDNHVRHVEVYSAKGMWEEERRSEKDTALGKLATYLGSV